MQDLESKQMNVLALFEAKDISNPFENKLKIQPRIRRHETNSNLGWTWQK
jgi:hypothetical protein